MRFRKIRRGGKSLSHLFEQSRTYDAAATPDLGYIRKIEPIVFFSIDAA
jgi:hypothetical protein